MGARFGILYTRILITRYIPIHAYFVTCIQLHTLYQYSAHYIYYICRSLVPGDLGFSYVYFCVFFLMSWSLFRHHYHDIHQLLEVMSPGLLNYSYCDIISTTATSMSPRTKPLDLVPLNLPRTPYKLPWLQELNKVRFPCLLGLKIL